MKLTAILLAAMVPASPIDTWQDERNFIGSWIWSPTATCSETYTFKDNGTLVIKSGAEVTEHTYKFSHNPIQPGFSKLEFTTIKDNLSEDCAGHNKDDTGRVSVMYLRTTTDGNQLLNCQKANGKNCWTFDRVQNP